MRIAVIVMRQTDGRTFEETYEEGDGSRRGLTAEIVDIDAWARGLADYWNGTLRPGEQERSVISVTVRVAPDAKATSREHDWRKTNLVTKEARGQHFDEMKCARCGITGKRHGLARVTLDAKFRRAKKWERCAP